VSYGRDDIDPLPTAKHTTGQVSAFMIHVTQTELRGENSQKAVLPNMVEFDISSAMLSCN